MSAVTPTSAAAEVLNCDCVFAGTKLEWTRSALHRKENLGSPLHTFLKIAHHANELTPSRRAVTNVTMRSLLAPIPMSFMMEEADAKECLEVVVKKVVTRAAKRKAEAVAAAAAERRMGSSQEGQWPGPSGHH